MQPARREPPITLVSALHRRDATELSARLSDGHRMHVSGSPFAIARTIAERVDRIDAACGPERDGAPPRHGLVVTLDPGADTRAVGMLLANAARSETGDDRIVRHVVAVLRAPEVAHLLWSDVDDAFVASERIAAAVEYATVIVLRGVRALSDDHRRKLVSLVHRLAPQTSVMADDRVRGGRDLPASNGTGSRLLVGGAGWMRALSDDGDRPGRDPGDGLVAFRYREPMPFHPGRLAAVIEDTLAPGSAGRVLRSKGFFRLASRPDHVGSWSSLGAMLALDPTANASWDEDAPLGQALWFVGEDLDVRAITDALDDALLRPDELLAGPDAWRAWADPFPVWPALDHEHE
jgi:G3E family GTPase